MKKSQHIFLLFTFSVIINSLSAQIVDTIDVFSKKMERNIKNIIILPESYKTAVTKHYPVLYLLHGAGADYNTWTKTIRKDLPELVSQKEMIIICPDGQDSWYLDSPEDSTSQFETYIVHELIEYADKHYRTIQAPKSRAIAGFSMGGYGALRLTILHPDIFGACGSMSGAVDLRAYPKIFKLPALLGSYSSNKTRWDKYAIINMLDTIKPNTFPIIMDCGKDDEFLNVNKRLHQAMTAKNIEHKFTIKPGRHNPAYWREAIIDQLQFFSDYFNRK